MDKCEFCHRTLTKEECNIGVNFPEDEPCDCKIIRKIARREKEMKKLKYENKMLNNFLWLANPYEWDVESCYEDILNGTDNGNDIGGKPDKEFAEWFARRFNVEVNK